MVTIIVLVNYTPVQNYLARQAAGILSKKLKTRVEIAHVRIDFLNHFLLQGLYIQDQAHDTLLYAGEAQVRISDWFIFRDRPTLHYLSLENAFARLYRPPHSKEWNYDFIADAFSTGKKSPGGRPFEFDLKKLELTNVRFHMDDNWGGEDLDFDLGSFIVNANDLDFNKKLLDISNIDIKNTDVYVNEYKAGHPPRPKGTYAVPVIDTTPFNPEKWMVLAKSLTLKGCTFHLTMDNNIPDPGLFDQNHLIVKNIQIATHDLSIVGDTVQGTVDNLFAQDRCGLTIKKMRSKVTVSPIASVCENLYLETNNSKIQNYYAMHYKRFPDFTSYIDSVVMVGHIRNSTIDIRDIAYFAPELKKFPEIVLQASGDGKGTVANLAAQHMVVSDGNSSLKGNIAMKGLPDIYKTRITYTDGELITNGSGILRYVPGLRNSPNVAFEKITYAWFKGSYDGYIENFEVNGIVRSNLGSLSADIKLNIPGFNGNTAVYSGSVMTDDLQLGVFLKQPLLGGITLKEDISGSSFSPDMAQLNLDGNVKEITLNNYAYHNIITHGTLAKKQFNGTLLVDDPNLALEFDGDINYSNKNVNIKATAHLLGSNFKALHLTTDPVTATADFDLNCTGNNIDNFSGYAKLNNIAIRRNANKVALDSILIKSTGDSLNKLLSIRSNDVLATIKGNYQLSKLAASFQFYLSRYLPNYVKAPDKFAPNQNFSFTVKTYNIDSLLAVTLPFARGFDSSYFSGSLNTTAKKLTLTAAVPYGSIEKFHMTNISINGIGNLDMIGLNATIDNVSIGDSIVNGSLSLTTTVANDSVAFTVATAASDTGNSITLAGLILARKDSLFLTLLPSQFYLNQTKWDITGGSQIVYCNNYLLVDGLALTSGLQKISASSQYQQNDQSILINTENLDLGQLGSWAGLAVYQPDGRVNGTIKLDSVFGNPYLSANLKATNVVLGTDTVGTINIIGSYDAAKKLVTFDPQTGIYRGNASVAIAGNISFDSSTNQKLDGSMQFNDAPVSWASPFLIGIMSHLSGTLNGTVKFDGTSYKPVLEGSVTLQNGGLRLDYMGFNYTIPEATIHVDNHLISFGKVTIFDTYKNTATLTGYFSHNLFSDIRMDLRIVSEKIEVMNLTKNDNNLFYGNLFAKMDSFTVIGPFNNVSLNAYNAAPAAKSRIFIPETSSASGDLGYYSFASFKNYGKNQEKIRKRNKDKISINIDAHLTPLAEMHIVLDPATGDEIMARGEGQLLIDIPPDNDVSINGVYNIDNGLYSYTFKSLRGLQKRFKLEAGSTISFNGPFSQTTLKVDAVYSTKARLYDLLSDADKLTLSGSDLTDAQTAQIVNVILHMNGLLSNSKLTFDIDLEDTHSQGSLVYQKLKIINNDEQQKFNQVMGLLLIGDFVSPEGLGGSTVATGAINNIGQILSSTTSTALTGILNKLTGDKAVNVDVKYTNYNYSDVAVGAVNRNEVKVGLNKTYFNDRLQVELGSTSDWGRPASASATSNFNFTGDFRLQYQLSQASNTRLSVFRTSDYDVTLDRDIVRSGMGISWHKSFDQFSDFFHGNKYDEKQKKIQLEKFKEAIPDSTVKVPGTE